MLQRIDRYEIVLELGRGSMGIVYKAHDPAIGRYVAIKTVRLGDFSAADQVEELRNRLRLEAQSAGRLSHPNIITIFDVGEEGGLSFIAMELIEGASLEDLLEAGQVLSEASILHVAYQVADALGYAHRREVIHRDIKPANIMVTREGRVKVADFGIAKIGSTKMTQTGMLLGSPSYMAPELFLGENLDGRSDIFALGIVLYELLTENTPFEGENLGALTYKIVHEDPVPPSELKPSINPQLNNLVMKMLARNPEQRFQDADELCKALEEIIAHGYSADDASTELQSLLEKVSVTSAEAPGEDKRQPFPLKGSPSRTTDISSIPFQKTLQVPPPVTRSRFRWLAYTASFFIFVAFASLVFALFAPERFKLTLDYAKTQRWFERWTQSSDIASDTAATEPSVSEPISESEAAAPEEPTIAEPATPPPEPSKPVVIPKETVSPPTPDSPRDSTAKRVARAAQATKVVPEVRLATIEISSTPPGARIILDDKENSKWVTPYTFHDVSPGRHTLDIKKLGYKTERRIFIVFGGETQKISVVLGEVSGILKISTIPAGAQIYIDGQLKSELTPATLTLRAGAYRVLLRRQGYLDVEQLIEIEDNSVTTLNQQLALKITR